MKRNYFHLFAALSSIAFLVWELILFVFFLYDVKDVSPVFNNFAWLAPIFIYLLVIYLGVMQLLREKDNSRKYAAWLTIFLSWIFIPIIVSLVMFERSGLSKKQQEIGIKKWYIDHIVELRVAIEADKKLYKQISKQTWNKVFIVRELQNEGFLDTYNGNAYKYNLLTNEVPQSQLPKIYDINEIISTEKDIPMNKKKA